MLDLDRLSLTCFDSSDRRVEYLPFFRRRTVSVPSALVELLLVIVHSHILRLSSPGSPWTVLEVGTVPPDESWLDGDDLHVLIVCTTSLLLESFCVSSRSSATFGSISILLQVDDTVVLEGGSGRMRNVLVLGLGQVDRWETLLVVLAEQGSCAISTLSSLILTVKY